MTANLLLKLLKQLHGKKSKAEFGFFVVNETKQVFPYHTAILWDKNLLEKPKVSHLSGVTQVDRHIPYVQFLEQLIDEAAKQVPEGHTVLYIQKNKFSENLQKNWHESLPPNLCLALMLNEHQEISGGLLFAQSQAWSKEQHAGLAELLTHYQFSWENLTTQRSWGKKFQTMGRRKRQIIAGAIVIIVLILIIPIHLTVLAPAQVIPKDPKIIASPLSGVIQTIAVRPNTPVKADELLFSLDKTELSNENKIANRELGVAKAEYRKAVQTGFDKEEARMQIKVLSNLVAEKTAQLNYSRDLLNQADVKSPGNGILVYSDKSDWIGRPVETGEKVMLVAKAGHSEMEIWLPVDETINFKLGDTVMLIPNNSPLSPVKGSITHTSFDAQLTPQDVLAYRIIAKFNKPQSKLRFGERGTAKIYGERVSIFYYLFRRPISALRQFVGF